VRVIQHDKNSHLHQSKRIFVSSDLGDYYCAPLTLDSITFEGGYFTTQQLVKKVSVAAVQRAFRTLFHTAPRWRLSTSDWCKIFRAVHVLG
jgi:hypothetical protein